MASRSFLAAGCLPLLAWNLLVAADPPAEGKASSDPEVRKAIYKYLVEKAGRAPSGTSVPDKVPYVWSSEQYDKYEKNPKTLYFLINEHLVLAQKRYLASKEAKDRRSGLGMAVEACRCAIDPLKDSWLAVKISEAYILPHLDEADQEQWRYLGKQNVLEVVADAYAEAKDAEKLMGVFKMLIENAANRNTADGGRLRMAQVLARLERYEEAIRYLKDIDDKEGVGGAKALIPDYEKKLKDKQAKEKK